MSSNGGWRDREPQDPPLPNQQDRLTAVALVRALANERPEDLPAIWSERRAAEVGMAGLGLAALFARQIAALMRASGDRSVVVDDLLDAMAKQALNGGGS